MTSTIPETPSFGSSDPQAPQLTPPMPPPEGDSITIVLMPPLHGDSSTIVPPAVATTISASAHAPDPPTAHTALDGELRSSASTLSATQNYPH
ncbi:hypothetical protein IV203_023107 [Nitzschia inconspicua]|uniref:Uncharacterized protein n=1 Tax=Nitzschia inconspicua TaxID=303405 RepID=A0A9K3PBY2_9STRA|nr:hypothetical protein IV203_023107 [Nitzschia inconspicua]